MLTISTKDFYQPLLESKFIVYCDGAARGNPGEAGAGIMIKKDNKNYRSISAYLGRQTNNYAEYTAVILAFKELIKIGAQDVEIYLDSNLVVQQLNGKWKVKNKNIKPLYTEAYELKKQIKNINIQHVYRADNKEADKLANIGADKHTVYTSL